MDAFTDNRKRVRFFWIQIGFDFNQKRIRVLIIGNGLDTVVDFLYPWNPHVLVWNYILYGRIVFHHRLFDKSTLSFLNIGRVLILNKNVKKKLKFLQRLDFGTPPICNPSKMSRKYPVFVICWKLLKSKTSAF